MSSVHTGPFRAVFVCILVTVAAALSAAPVVAQSAGHGQPEGWVGGHGSANFDLAARWAPYRIQDMSYSMAVNPQWIEGGDRFWYEWEDRNGTHFWLVDPARGTKTAIFDNDRIAAELTRITLDPYDGQHLPIETIRFIDQNTIQFDVTSSQDVETDDDTVEEEQDQEEERAERKKPKKKVFHFEYDVDTRTLRQLEDFEGPDNHPSWANVSPDGETVVFVRNHNLFMMTAAEYARILDARRGLSGEEADSADQKLEVEETQFTEDGELYYSWGTGGRGSGPVDSKKDEEYAKRNRAPVSWASDSRRFATVRSDCREVGKLWVIHNTGSKRPELETYCYDMPGEQTVTNQEVWVAELTGGTGAGSAGADGVALTQVDDDPWPDQTMVFVSAQRFDYPDSTEPEVTTWASDDPNHVYFMRRSRDRKKLDLVRWDATTGQATVLIEERSNTYLEERQRPTPRVLSNGDILWWSEEDGRGHLYRHAADGTRTGRLTEGPWTVADIVSVDEGSGTLFFTAAGREQGMDPYYIQFYRMPLGGGGIQRLSPDDFDNQVEMSESSRFTVHTYSRVNTVPESVVRNASGNVVVNLETADLSRLVQAGWQMPETFTVKAADGVTDLYGVIYKPFDFDPEKVYPVVEYVYPGPQTESVAKAFNQGQNVARRYEVSLAQFGFIVVTVGNRGGHPHRSKWYHNYGYGNLRDYGLADKKVTVEQLAQRHPWVDQGRVGIYGHSGGGFMSTAAMLVYPDFFDVAVSSSGNHANDVYNRWWSESHHGVELVEEGDSVRWEYEIDTNPDIAKNLKGRLLLTTGDRDNNVHHAGTVRMAEALIRANKRFDYFIFPGQRHGYGDMGDYWFWLRAEYFVRHLMGDTRWEVDVTPLNLEREAGG
jgi:dipeptidyl aminopeptidase/acylaminoacyl peptidase